MSWATPMCRSSGLAAATVGVLCSMCVIAPLCCVHAAAAIWCMGHPLQGLQACVRNTVTAIATSLLPPWCVHPTGGMLTAWFRMKYPHLLDGGIAASAPIWTYLGEDPPVDPGAFAKIVTGDAWPEGGSAHDCADNVRVRGAEAWRQHCLVVGAQLRIQCSGCGIVWRGVVWADPGRAEGQRCA